MANNVDWRLVATGFSIGIAGVVVRIVLNAYARKQVRETQKILDETSELVSHWRDDMKKIYYENQKYESDLFERLNTKKES